MTNNEEILNKINLKIENSKKILNNPYYFRLSKLQIFIYNLLDIRIIKFFVKCLIKITNKFDHLLELKKYQKTFLDPNIISSETEFRSPYGYNEFQEIERFFENIKRVKEKRKVELFFDRINYVINETEKLIKLDSKIKNLASIGCSYAYYESIIANKFNDVNVHCFDRSEHTTILNRKEFSLSNMKFYYGNILDFVAKKTNDSTIFNHMWTAAYFPKNLLDNIYSNLNKNKVKYIILIEPAGISQETGEMYKFSFQDSPSVKYRNNIFIHNYPGMLKKNNYLVQSCELTKIPGIYGEFLLKIIAKKND